MPRPAPHDDFRSRLNEILTYPEVKERFEELEKITVDAIAGAKRKKEILRLVEHLKVLRQFRQGVATVTQIKRLREVQDG